MSNDDINFTKLNLKTEDIAKKNLEKLKQLFPDIFTETYDEETDSIVNTIDANKLQQLTSTKVIDSNNNNNNNIERYEFTWVGKRNSMIQYNIPTNQTLRPCREESVNYDTTQNLYIEGDNLEVLKLLRNSYSNKIKMIYIDPPYNTGKDFIYKDNFKKDKETYLKEIGYKDEDGNIQFKENTNTNPRFHSDWCSMIYPRLKLARDLLSEDGVIFISIDDNEVDNLRKICDEVFGGGNV